MDVLTPQTFALGSYDLCHIRHKLSIHLYNANRYYIEVKIILPLTLKAKSGVNECDKARDLSFIKPSKCWIKWNNEGQFCGWVVQISNKKHLFHKWNDKKLNKNQSTQIIWLRCMSLLPGFLVTKAFIVHFQGTGWCRDFPTWRIRLQTFSSQVGDDLHAWITARADVSKHHVDTWRQSRPAAGVHLMRRFTAFLKCPVTGMSVLTQSKHGQAVSRWRQGVLTRHDVDA